MESYARKSIKNRIPKRSPFVPISPFQILLLWRTGELMIPLTPLLPSVLPEVSSSSQNTALDPASSTFHNLEIPPSAIC